MLTEPTERKHDAFVLQHRNPVARDYVMVSREVLMGYPHLSDGAKITYWVIYSHDWYERERGGRKGYAYPTTGRLANLRHTTDRTIRRHVQELVEVGLITRVIRHGRPSILYIEEPKQEVGDRVFGQRRQTPDISDRGGRTFLSGVSQVIKNKQTKPVNGVKKDLMDEGRDTVTGGWKPIKALLKPDRIRRETPDRVKWLADQIIAQTGDEHSLGCYRLIAGRCSQELVFEALSLLKEARRDGTIQRSRGALFLGIVRRLCRERGLPDPLATSRNGPIAGAVRADAHQGLAPPSG